VLAWKERPCAPTCCACLEVADKIRDAWFAKWTEARQYLAWHSNNVEATEREFGYSRVQQIYSGRIRGGADYCAEANGDFQALLADIAKRALIRVAYEQYVIKDSPLYQVSRTIVFAHDELFGECRTEVGHEVSMRVNEIMVEEFVRGCPRHAAACKAEPTLMPRWWKAAEPVYSESGRLVPWTPKKEKAA
jgi:hypothetical protein